MSVKREALSAVRQGVALADRSERIRFWILGTDRARFLHNLTTNDINRLSPGQSCEAFVTTPQGKTLGFLSVHATDGALLVRSDSAGFGEVRAHLTKYGVFDEVEFEDRTDGSFELHLCGARAGEYLAGLTGGLVDGPSHFMANVEGVGPIRVIREEPAGMSGFTLIGELAARDPLLERLKQGVGSEAGLTPLDGEHFEALRIMAGTPVYGRDLTVANLPQELGRNAQAISFNKGCYLGQETVARLDALGHVNKQLTGLRGDGSPPEPTAALKLADGKTAGTLTSIALLAGGGWVGLGMVRVTASKPGEVLMAGDEGSSATVVPLPMPLEAIGSV